MLYKGRIEELKRMVVSDPSYGENVWCRYENNQFPVGRNWAVQMAVRESSEEIDGFTLSGIDFQLMIYKPAYEGLCRLNVDENSFYHPSSVKIGEPKEIGMDTACVALGINEHADAIKAAQGAWQPECSLKTLTDGFFGTVHEGKVGNQVVMLVVSGYLDEDTGYTAEDVARYLEENFEIKELELVKDIPSLDKKISAVKDARDPGKVENKGSTGKDEMERE